MATLASVFCCFALVLINIAVNATVMDDEACLKDLNLVGTYDNTDYYLSKANDGDFDKAQAVCKSFGGKLVEIDNESEYTAIRLFLNTTIRRPFSVWIGATDAASEGNWVYPSNNQPIPFLAWYSGEQPGGSLDGGTRENCADLNSNYNWRMGNYRCNSNSFYMCERLHNQ